MADYDQHNDYLNDEKEQEDQPDQHQDQHEDFDDSLSPSSSQISIQPTGAAAAGGISSSSYPPAAVAHATSSYNIHDSQLFHELPLQQALNHVIERYSRYAIEQERQKPNDFMIAAVGNIQASGMALLLNGNNEMNQNNNNEKESGASNTTVKKINTANISSLLSSTSQLRLNDSILCPLFHILNHNFSSSLPITHLDVSSNHLSLLSMQAICEFILTNDTLVSVDLSKNDFGPDAGEVLGKTLVEMANRAGAGKTATRTLRKLNLSNNAFGGLRGLSPLFTYLRSPNCTVQDLNLSNTEIDIQTLNKLVNSSLMYNTSLKRLNLDSPLLSGNNETDTAVYIYLCKYLSTSSYTNKLLSLSLKSHRLNDEVMKLFYEMLHKNTTLCELNLSRNYITTTGVAGFVEVLAKRPCETYIVFDSNPHLTGQTFGKNNEVAEALEDLKQLRSGNEIVWQSKQEKHSLRAKVAV